jgi:hypothetical protein
MGGTPLCVPEQKLMKGILNALCALSLVAGDHTLQRVRKA